MAIFKIRRHSPQWDNQGLCRGNPYKVGSENLKDLSRYALVEIGPGKYSTFRIESNSGNLVQWGTTKSYILW